MKDLTPYSLPPSLRAEEEHLPDSPPVFEGEPLHLWDYWQVIRKYRWIIGACFLLVVLTAAMITFTTTPIYVAETTLLIERKAPKVLDVREVQNEATFDYDEYDYYRTQYEILKSRALAAQVIRAQSLDKNRTFIGKDEEASGPLGRLWRDSFGWNKASSPLPLSTPELQDLVGAYLGNLEVRPIPHTRLVRIAFRSPNPQLCALVANAHAQAYIRQGIDLRSEANEAGLRFLEEKLVELKERVEHSEAALNQYRREKGIISLDDKENIVIDRLTDLNKRLTEAEAERIGLEAQVQLLRTGRFDSLPGVLGNPLIQSLKQQLTTVEGEVAHLATQFKDDYPPLKQLKAQVAETQRRVEQEVKRAADGIMAAYQSALGKETELRTRMDEQKKATLSLKDASVEYAVLAREVDTNRQLYDSVLQRMKEMGVATELRTSNVSVIDQANPPHGPAHPNNQRNLLFGALLGLLGGVGLAFFLEYLDNTMKTPEQAERELGVPSLSVVPHFLSLHNVSYGDGPKIVRNARRQLALWGGVKKAIWLVQADQETKQIVVSHHPLSAVSESYRTLRAGILLSRAGEPPRTILFTSGVHAEGKTSTTLNTAITFAQMGVQVLVVDADLRRPSCHKVLHMKGDVGLSEVLSGQRSLQGAICATSIENLSLLGSGAIPPNPAELIGSVKMHETLMALREQFAYIFVDSPPVMPVSDALLLAKMVDGVVMVISGQETPKKVIKEARARLTYARAKILGTVLNKVDLQRSGYYYHNHYYYSPYHRPEEAEEE